MGIVAFTEKQFHDLDALIGEIREDVEDIKGDIGEAVTEYLDEHGVALSLTVTDGDLDISIT